VIEPKDSMNSITAIGLQLDLQIKNHQPWMNH